MSRQSSIDMVNVCLGKMSVKENKKYSGTILNTIVWRHLESQDALYIVVFIQTFNIITYYANHYYFIYTVQHSIPGFSNKSYWLSQLLLKHQPSQLQNVVFEPSCTCPNVATVRENGTCHRRVAQSRIKQVLWTGAIFVPALLTEVMNSMLD